MKKILIFFALLILLPARGAFAQNVSLGIYPPVMQIEAMPPAEVSSKFTLQNQSSEPLELDIQVKAFKPSSSNNGQVEILDNFESLPDPLMVNRIKIKDKGLSVKSLTLSPNQTKEFDLEIAIPVNEAKGDYYLTLFFVSKPQTNISSNSTLTSAGVAMNLLITVGPKGEAKGFIEKFSAPFFVDSGPVPFTIQVENQSDHFLPISGEIVIENIFGQKIGKVNLLAVNVLAGSKRLIPDDKQADTTTKDYEKIESIVEKSNYPVAIWPEKFLLGPYKATLSLGFSEDGPQVTKTISFFAFPATYLIAILIVLAVVAFILIRVKRKMD